MNQRVKLTTCKCLAKITYFLLVTLGKKCPRIHRPGYPGKWRADEASFYDDPHGNPPSPRGFVARLDICGYTYVTFFLCRESRHPTEEKGEMKKKSRYRGDNNVRFDRKDVRRTHTHAHTSYRDFLLVTCVYSHHHSRDPSLLSTLPFIPRHTRYRCPWFEPLATFSHADK